MPPKNSNARPLFDDSQRKQNAPGASLANKKPGGTQNKKKGFGGCCVRKNKDAPKRAAPPSNGPKRSFSSLFSRRNKLKKSKDSSVSARNLRPRGKTAAIAPGTPSKIGGPAGSIRSLGQPHRHLQKQQLPKKVTSRTDPKKKSSKSDRKEVQKIPIEGASRKGGDSLNLDHAEKVMKKKSKKPTEAETAVAEKVSHRIGKERALETCRNFQEVKVCVVGLANGMTERKLILTTLYPSDKHPPKPFNPVASTRRKKSSTSLRPTPTSSERMLLTSPEKPPLVAVAPSSTALSYRDRALSTIYQLRGHYQLSHDEIRLLAKNPNLKVITIRAGIALQEAQRNLRNLRILAGNQLLPDLPLFSDELSAVILELDRFIDAIHTVSEHAEVSPTKKISRQ